MTDIEVLRVAMEKAIKNGYKEPFVFGMGSDFALNKFILFKLYFNHDFAKAFWGEDIPTEDAERYSLDIHYYSSGESFFLNNWQYHLSKMVLEKDPIDYLRKFIEDGK